MRRGSGRGLFSLSGVRWLLRLTSGKLRFHRGISQFLSIRKIGPNHRFNPRQIRCLRPLGMVKIPRPLQIQPELRAVADILGQPQRQRRGNPPPLADQFVDFLTRNKDGVGQFLRLDSQFCQELILQQHARMGRFPVGRYSDHNRAATGYSPTTPESPAALPARTSRCCPWSPGGTFGIPVRRKSDAPSPSGRGDT